MSETSYLVVRDLFFRVNCLSYNRPIRTAPPIRSVCKSHDRAPGLVRNKAPLASNRSRRGASNCEAADYVKISELGLPAPRASDEPMESSVSGASSIEITLANGHRIAVKGSLDGEAMCRLVRSLAGL